MATRYALTLGGLGVFTLLAGRFLLASPILVALTLLHSRQRLTMRDFLKCFLVALVFPGLYFLFENHGIARTSAFLASIIIASIPILTGILARFFLKEHLGLQGWLGAFLSIAGIITVILLAAPSSGKMLNSEEVEAVFTGTTVFGALLLVAAAVMGAVYITAARHLMARYRPLTLSTIQSLLGLLFFSPLALLEISRGDFSMNVWGLAAVGFLGIGASLIGFLAFNHALRSIEAGKASLFLNLVPLLSLIFGWIFLGERLYPAQALGGFAVVGGG
ncbi:hypothetical protein ES703_29631 [subsurface metagenome]